MPRRGPDWVPALTHLKRAGRGRVRIPGRPDIYLGPPGCWPARTKTPPVIVRQEYDRAVADWLKGRGATPRRRGYATVAILLAEYLKHAVRYYVKRDRPTTEVGLLRQAAREILDFCGPHASPDELSPAKLRELQDAIAARSLVRRTVNALIARVKRIWQWGVEHDLVRSETWYGLLAVRGLTKGRGARDNPDVEPVSDESLERTIAALPSRHQAIGIALQVQRLAGMRPCEVVALCVSALDCSGDVWVYRVPETADKLAHKGGRPPVCLGPKAQALLTPLFVQARTADRDHLFVTSRRPMTPHHYARETRKAARAAGVPPFGVNRLRHSAATALEQDERFGLEGAQKLLGHASASMTERYIAKNLAEAKRIAREVG